LVDLHRSAEQIDHGRGAGAGFGRFSPPPPAAAAAAPRCPAWPWPCPAFAAIEEGGLRIPGREDGMGASDEAVIARLAAAQHGVVTRAQLLAAGVAPGRINRRLRDGRLVAVHAGVFRVGLQSGPRAAELAAVLACGRGAVLSHGSAAALWLLAPPSGPGDGSVHVTLPAAARVRRPGIIVHRHPLDADEVAVRDGVPVTGVARTLLDFGTVASPRALEQAMARAEREHPREFAGLPRLLERRARHAGAPPVLALLRPEARRVLTESELEDRFLFRVRRARLPEPVGNAPLLGYRVDFLWPDFRVIAELDGYAWHGSRRAFRADRDRDRRLSAAGYRILRVTWEDLEDEPEATMVSLALTLAGCTTPVQTR
jgi:very-short-patch-repair endonuclease